MEEQNDDNNNTLELMFSEESMLQDYAAISEEYKKLVLLLGQREVKLLNIKKQLRAVKTLSRANNEDADRQFTELEERVRVEQQEVSNLREEKTELQTTLNSLQEIIRGVQTNEEFISHSRKQTGSESEQLVTSNRSEGKSQQASSRPVPIPSNLPQFDSRVTENRADRFIEKLEMMLETRGVEPYRWTMVLRSCCDINTASWVKNNCGEDIDWVEAKKRFLAHYWTPYQRSFYYLELLEATREKNESLVAFSDRFLRMMDEADVPETDE